MDSYIDLHIHTTASDGTFTPSQVVSLAFEAGLKAVAITDHDTVEGNKEALEMGDRLGFEVVPGVEISCGQDGGEVHILGYFIDWRSKVFQKKLSLLRDFREKRNPQIINKLRHIGIDITYEEVKLVAGGESVGRPHIAHVLKEKGYVFSSQNAFDRYLKKGRAAYVPKELISVGEVIDMVHNANGLAVIAHPIQSLSVAACGIEGFIGGLVDEGIDGIEVYYSSHSKEDVTRLLHMACKYNLFVVGGTDFHGEVKPGVELGIGMGDMRISCELLENMKKVLERRREKICMQ